MRTMIKDYGPVNDRSPHLIADLLEIRCFFERSPMARGDVESIVERDGGAGLKAELKIEEGDDTDSSAEKNDRVQQLSEDVFANLMYRAEAFDDWYPFTVKQDVLELASFTNRRRVYLLLLVCSRLKMFPKAVRGVFAADFELLSVEALKGLYPGWDVIHFGKGGKDRPRFGNKFKVAIAKLAKLLKDPPIQDRIDAISNQNVGDGGIDIVALNTFGDAAPGCTVFFAQCAAQQTGWPEKKFEAHPVEQSKHISFFHNPGNLLTIPLCYRGPDGKWVSDEAYGAILLDRLRLVKLIEGRRASGIADAVATIPPELMEQMT
jgi:hypothetical protein